MTVKVHRARQMDPFIRILLKKLDSSHVNTMAIDFQHFLYVNKVSNLRLKEEQEWSESEIIP